MKKISLTSLLLILLFSFYTQLIQANHNSSHKSPRPTVEKIKDLRKTARLAQEKSLPILIMFGTDGCPYCRLLKEDFLIPMLISGDYQDKVIIREAHISPGESIIDFQGKKISIGEFSQRYKVTLFPTMAFVDNTGQPLIKNIIGVTTPSLFGGTLDDSIDQAHMMVK
ncbi:MAG: thioredoxin fold domain-containing protein [Gammaproteobacteria bacterium]|nr:thioredoxin fold domain-containing protein [Gammaproteobacteria bacterium]